MRLKLVFLAIASVFSAGSVLAQESPVLMPIDAATASGTYAGTFLCSLGEMGMTLALKDTGPATTPEDIGQMPCKSGAGPCNTRQDAEIDRSRTVEGILNFFPLLSNPEAPKGVFTVSGAVNYSMQHHWRVKVSPKEWVEKPDKFGWSGLEGTIYKGKLSGKPTAQGCHTLSMTKIRTVD